MTHRDEVELLEGHHERGGGDGVGEDVLAQAGDEAQAGGRSRNAVGLAAVIVALELP
jgi:hypothetical protein